MSIYIDLIINMQKCVGNLHIIVIGDVEAGA